MGIKIRKGQLFEEKAKGKRCCGVYYDEKGRAAKEETDSQKAAIRPVTVKGRARGGAIDDFEMGVRDDLIEQGVRFLQHPKVQSTPMSERLKFLEKKGLSASVCCSVLMNESIVFDGDRCNFLNAGKHQEISKALEKAEKASNTMSSSLRDARHKSVEGKITNAICSLVGYKHAWLAMSLASLLRPFAHICVD